MSNKTVVRINHHDVLLALIHQHPQISPVRWASSTCRVHSSHLDLVGRAKILKLAIRVLLRNALSVVGEMLFNNTNKN